MTNGPRPDLIFPFFRKRVTLAFMRLCIVVVALSVAVPLRADAWEVACYAPPSFPTVRAQVVELKNYAKCSADADFAYGHRMGEHYDICMATYEALHGKPLDAAGAAALSLLFSATTIMPYREDLATSQPLKQFIWSRTAYKSSSFDAARLRVMPGAPTDVQGRQDGIAYWLCEFAALPDQSMGLVDWAKGMVPEDCPTGAPCRTFEELGPISRVAPGEARGSHRSGRADLRHPALRPRVRYVR